MQTEMSDEMGRQRGIKENFTHLSENSPWKFTRF